MLNQHFIKSSFIPHTDIYMDASISRIVTHLLVYNHGKYHAFIKKCTIVALNSPTTTFLRKIKCQCHFWMPLLKFPENDSTFE